MKINTIGKINFKRNISYIDMHTHDKPIEKLGKSANEQDLLKFTRKNIEIDGDVFVPSKIIPTSLDCCFYKDGKPYAEELNGNEDILKSFSNTSIKNFYATCQPKTGSVENIEKLFEKYPDKFVGLKFHPNGAELEADNLLYDSYLEFAKKKGLPCLFHSDRSVDTTYKWIENGVEKSSTQMKSKYSRPEQIYKLAKRHPDVPVIMAHFGGPEKEDINATIDTIVSSVKNNDAKMYADISWVDIDNSKETMDKIAYIIEKLKNSDSGDLTDRVLFGTDAPIDRFNYKNANENYENFVTGIYKTIKSNFDDDADEIIDKIFYKNANELFFEKNWAKEAKENVEAIAENDVIKNLNVPEKIAEPIKNLKKFSKAKVGAMVALGALVVGAATAFIIKHNKKASK